MKKDYKEYSKDELDIKIYNLRLELKENPRHRYAKDMYENLIYYEGLLGLPGDKPVEDGIQIEEEPKKQDKPRKQRGSAFTSKKEGKIQGMPRHMLSGKKRSG